MPKLSRRTSLLLAGVPAGLLIAILYGCDMIAPTAAIILALAFALPLVWVGNRWQEREQASTDATKPDQVDGRLGLQQQILERLPDPVLILDRSRRVISVNRAARETLEVIEPGRDLALSLRHPTVLTAVEALLNGGAPVIDEITVPAPNPRTLTLYASGLPDTGDAMEARVILVLRDATHAKRAEQSRADFVANASHELRSPLSALIGFIETLRGPASDDTGARERFLMLMHGEALRMARLIDDLMSLSRVELNEHVLPKDPVDLADILATVVDTLCGRAEARRMTIVLECPSGLPPVIGDDDQLIQVFHNLVDNAIKYGTEGTQVRISVASSPRLPTIGSPGIMVKVIDQSDGIPAIHLPRLTERFYRVDDSRARRRGGTGLGLAIVKHIVNRHRGRLIVESERGVGSTFTVVLPTILESGRLASSVGADEEAAKAPAFIKT